MPRSLPWAAGAALALVAAPGPVRADEIPCGHSWRFQLENDTSDLMFGVPPGSDDNYTGGWRVSWSECGAVSGDVPWSADEGDTYRERVVTWSIGQNFYSPEAIDTLDLKLLQDDRPFAGVASISRRVTYTWDRRPATELTYGVEAGVLGPAGLGRQFQSFIHSFVSLGSKRPLGWDDQIGGAPELNGSLRLARQIWPIGGGNYWQAFDVIGHAEAIGGTTWLRAEGGLTLRAGWNVPASPDGGPIRPTAEGFPEPPRPGETPAVNDHEATARPGGTAYPPPVSAYVWASGALRLVGYNAYLQGSWAAWEDSPITRKPERVVFEIGFGGVLIWQCWSLTYGVHLRTPEMADSDVEPDWERFAEVQLGYLSH